MAGSTSAWFLHLILERTFQLEGTVFYGTDAFYPRSIKALSPFNLIFSSSITGHQREEW